MTIIILIFCWVSLGMIGAAMLFSRSLYGGSTTGSGDLEKDEHDDILWALGIGVIGGPVVLIGALWTARVDARARKESPEC